MFAWKQLKVLPLLEANSLTLLSVNIDNCTRFNDELIKGLATHSINLKYFSWRFSERLTDDVFKMLILGKEYTLPSFLLPPKPGCKLLETIDLKYLYPFKFFFFHSNFF